MKLKIEFDVLGWIVKLDIAEDEEPWFEMPLCFKRKKDAMKEARRLSKKFGWPIEK